MRIDIGEKQIAADTSHHRGNIALHARHVADGHARADEARRIVDVNVFQIRRPPLDLFAIFECWSEIRMRAEFVVRVALGRRELIAPQQDMRREIGKLGARGRVDEIARASDREIEVERFARCDSFNLSHRFTRGFPLRAPMQTEILEACDALDRIQRRRRAGAFEAQRLRPAQRVGQIEVVVVRTRIGARA